MAYYTIKELNLLSHKTAREIALEQGMQRRPHPGYGELNHPQCETKGCFNDKTVADWHWTSGKPVYRPVCKSCHNTNTARKYAKKTGALWVRNVADVCAHKEGFTSTQEWLNSKHPWRKYRKDYCENIDGRLGGYKCTTTIVWDGMLDVDHKDEDPSNNTPKNLQTLCKCCHAYKGNVFVKKHGRTPGRKTLGIKY